MDLNKNNYFSEASQMEFFGASQFKAFMKCESAALAEIKGKYKRDESTALLMGGYIDAHFSDEMPKFVVDHPEIFNSRTGALKANFKQADEIIDRIERDPMMVDYLSGDTQKIMVGEIFNFPFKIKVDVLHSDKIVDLKIMRDLNPVYQDGEWKSFIDAWGYDLQGFIYQKIVEYNVGKKLPFYLAAATKETHPEIAIIEIPQWKLDGCAAIVKHYLPRFANVKNGYAKPKRCERCGWCRDTKEITAITTYEEILERGNK